MTILIDMDDVLNVLSTSWMAALNKKFGTNVTREDMVTWNTCSLFPGHTEQEVFSPLFDEEFWDTVPPMPGARECVSKLREDGHKLYVLTNSHYKTVNAKFTKVLFKYFPEFTWQDIIIASDKSMIAGDILIDDAPHNMLGGDTIKLLFDSPWNRDFDENLHGVTRVHDWYEVVEAIEMLEGYSNRVVGVKQSN